MVCESVVFTDKCGYFGPDFMILSTGHAATIGRLEEMLYVSMCCSFRL